MLELNKIYNEDNISTLNRMEDNYLDLTITSPPYNVDLGNNKYNKNPYDLYNDNKEHKEYIEWLKTIFTLVYQKTKSGGRCIINIGDGQNGRVPTHSDIIQMMVQIGWIPLTIIVWDKNNVSNRTAWGSFMSPSSPSFPRTFEYVLAFSKEERKLQTKGETDLTKEEFIAWSLGKWSFTGESSKRIGHPAAFPIELPTRCMKLFSWINSIIYDPFMGSGTTAVSAIKNRRNYLGSEISAEYCDVANKRIAKYITELESKTNQLF
jgi:site-specific DNA-methyltransferase (adenine-specific)